MELQSGRSDCGKGSQKQTVPLIVELCCCMHYVVYVLAYDVGHHQVIHMQETGRRI
jgi:hypothetical protein